ncbi:hypothetical protein BJ508DRAFT_140266 [Ascobolus immersus RN42]|uniref:Uncharacterized protein n=1 Tax=Ascobolus immersus RN42 TaxID=1160509 RepID=A0A3N4ID13_ASCIM|nr:hypothetical protein BJ508DRAFT_140266 [Ascobolus immersus RN42]
MISMDKRQHQSSCHSLRMRCKVCTVLQASSTPTLGDGKTCRGQTQAGRFGIGRGWPAAVPCQPRLERAMYLYITSSYILTCTYTRIPPWHLTARPDPSTRINRQYSPATLTCSVCHCHVNAMFPNPHENSPIRTPLTRTTTPSKIADLSRSRAHMSCFPSLPLSWQFRNERVAVPQPLARSANRNV